MKTPNKKDPNRYYRLACGGAIWLLMGLVIISCRDTIEAFEFERIGMFSYSTDSLNIEYADEVKFYQGKTIIYTYEDGSTEVYTRFLLEARGESLAGNEVIIDIEFDIVPDGSFIDVYRPTFQKGTGGIHSFNYLEKNEEGTYNSFSLNTTAKNETFFRIQRQHAEEFLILGDFFAQLRNDKDSTDRLTLSEGVFKDIYYKLGAK